MRADQFVKSKHRYVLENIKIANAIGTIAMQIIVKPPRAPIKSYIYFLLAENRMSALP